jgi:multiple sugar transport system ATP-binding protein
VSGRGALTLAGVGKSFGKTRVIEGIDLAVEPGELVVFVGPSGCGKSTLLRMIAGLEDVTEGEIAMNGRRINELPPARREIAMVFQSYALYPHLTVRGNMGLALKQAGEGRVAIGRAIVRRPQLFLFDEPLSNLDAALRVATRIEIARLHRELGATMIYVTHDQIEAMTLADKIVVLQAGRIAQVGRPMDLYNDPDNIFVAGFIGSPQMNFLPGEVLGLSSAQVGIRPEHLAISADAGQIAGRVSHVEKLGGETLTYVAAETPGLLTVRQFGEQDHRVDAPVWLTPDPRRILHFDAEGRRLRG